MHQRVRAAPVVADPSEGFLTGGLRLPVDADVLRHRLHRLEQGEREEAEAVLAGVGRARLTRGGEPAGWVGVLVGLGGLDPFGEMEVGTVVGEPFLFPHAHHDLDRFAPLLPGPVIGRHPERDLFHRRGTPRAPLDPTVTQDVDGRDLLGDPSRVHEPEGHQHHPEAQAQVLGRERQPAQDRFGRRTRRAAVAEVVLDTPHRVEPQRVGEVDLGDRLVVGALLGVALPVGVRLGPRPDLRLELVQQIELHQTDASGAP